MIVSIFKSVNTLEKPREKEISFSELYDFFSKAAKKEIVKDEGPLFKLAKFGDLREAEDKSYRSNENVISVSGVVGDIDRNSPGFSEAVSILRKAGLRAIVKTSASYDPENKKIHVICPFSRGLPPEAHRREVAKLNRVFEGVLSPESFVLSQAFYFFPGIGKSQNAQVEAVDGECIDKLEIEPLYGAGGEGEKHQKNGKLPIEDDVVRACREKGLEPEWKGNGVWAMYCPWSRDKSFDVKGEKHKSRDDKGAKYLVPGYGGYLHPAFHCHHGTCVEAHRGLSDLLLFLGLKSENPFDEFPNSENAEEKEEQALALALNLSRFAINGQLEQLRAEIENTVYLMEPFAVRGECTVFWAKPNAGKTLLTLYMLIESIEAGRIEGKDVFYVNADDSQKGYTQKLELVEEYGIQILIPGRNGFSKDDVFAFVKASIVTGDAKKAVLVLDTVKKFVDTMDKNKAKNFAELLRQFIAVGGSAILLGHVNKHKNAEGQLIHEGVGDISNDADADNYLEVLPATGPLATVQVSSKKKRNGEGGVRYFTFNDSLRGDERNYRNVFESVSPISNEEGDNQKQQTKRHEQTTQGSVNDEDVISAIRECFFEGIDSQEAIRRKVQTVLPSASVRQIRRVLSDNCGEGVGYLWAAKKATNNTKIFSLNEQTCERSEFPETVILEDRL